MSSLDPNAASTSKNPATQPCQPYDFKTRAKNGNKPVCKNSTFTEWWNTVLDLVLHKNVCSNQVATIWSKEWSQPLSKSNYKKNCARLWGNERWSTTWRSCICRYIRPLTCFGHLFNACRRRMEISASNDSENQNKETCSYHAGQYGVGVLKVLSEPSPCAIEQTRWALSTLG